MAKWNQIWTDAVKNNTLLSMLTPGHIPTGFDPPRNLRFVGFGGHRAYRNKNL